MNKNELKAELLELSEENYKKFNDKLQSSKSEVLGVRVGHLRKLAKEIAKDNWRDFVINISSNDTFEEKLITGMSIFYSKADINEKIEYCKKMIPFVDGWAVCDSMCMTIKLKKDEEKIFWIYALECTESRAEFESRFGFVSMLHSFINDEHIDHIIAIVNNKSYSGYYDKMAAAWLLADCMVKFPDKTYVYMKNNCPDDWVHNKAISKMRESFRVSDEMKYELNKLVRK